jgi:phosphonate transport system ATP-binding protein
VHLKVTAGYEEATTASTGVSRFGMEGSGDRGVVLAARGIWLSYDGKGFALQGVSLSVERGMVTMLLGRSGSGKTSLLKVLGGLLKPQRGVVEVAREEGGQSRQHVAYIPQTLGLVRSLSALENTLTGALARSNTVRSVVRAFPAETVERARATLADLGIAHKAKEKVYHLSGGERQRVAIARALMQQPDVILADEFVSQLDPITAEEILGMIKRIAASGVGILVTTHETDVVAKYADRMLVMRDGKVSYEGTAKGMTEAAMVDLLR